MPLGMLSDMIACYQIKFERAKMKRPDDDENIDEEMIPDWE